MSNMLCREIEQKERIVIALKYLKDKTTSLEKRIFVCEGDGFGMNSYTMGNAIFGFWEKTKQKDRVEGFMIDVEETKEIQKTKKLSD